MTSSGQCACGRMAGHFHYTKPRASIYDPHEGYWICEDCRSEKYLLDKKETAASENKVDPSNFDKEPTMGMNRKERRYFKKTGKVLE